MTSTPTKRSLAPDAQGTYSLDALPGLLRESAPQVILAGTAWSDATRRHAAVERAALFAEQAKLAMLRGGRFESVTYIDVEAGEVWTYPWVVSSQWQAAAPAEPPGQTIRRVAHQMGLADEPAVPLEGDVRWRVRDGAGGQTIVTLAMPLPGGTGLRLVAADVPLAALDPVRISSGIGRFWVVDGEGKVVLDAIRSCSQPCRGNATNSAC